MPFRQGRVLVGTIRRVFAGAGAGKQQSGKGRGEFDAKWQASCTALRLFCCVLGGRGHKVRPGQHYQNRPFMRRKHSTIPFLSFLPPMIGLGSVVGIKICELIPIPKLHVTIMAWIQRLARLSAPCFHRPFTRMARNTLSCGRLRPVTSVP